MKNAEAIEYIKKNCYGEWCEDDWREAMDMAIEALKCSETPKSSERTAETAQNVQDEDLISRKAAIESIRECAETAHDNHEWDMEQGYLNAIECVEEEPSAQPEKVCIARTNLSEEQVREAVERAKNEIVQMLPSAQPDNQINLCDSCDYLYPDCPAKNDDVIFGNGIGNDNICACNKYKPSAQSEQRWIPCSERLPNTNGIYIVTRRISDGFEYRNITDACYFDGSNTWHDDTRVNHGRKYLADVLAWMPLPEPYRGGDE